MNFYTDSEMRRYKLRNSKGLPEPEDLLEYFLGRRKITELERQAVDKLYQLITEGGAEKARRLMAAVMSYIYNKQEAEDYDFGHFPLLKRTIIDIYDEKKGIIESAPIKGPYVDHFYSIRNKKSGKESVILEPYYIVHEDIKRLIQQCEAAGLTMDIDGHSSHFPGSTLRIILEEEKR